MGGGAAATPGNLPAELSSFVGRRHELQEIKSALSAARLVTLVGPGGVGKTRLALRSAADLRRGIADGVWLVELAGLEDAELVTKAVMTSLGLRDESSQLAGVPADRVSRLEAAAARPRQLRAPARRMRGARRAASSGGAVAADPGDQHPTPRCQRRDRRSGRPVVGPGRDASIGAGPDRPVGGRRPAASSAQGRPAPASRSLRTTRPPWSSWHAASTVSHSRSSLRPCDSARSASSSWSSVSTTVSSCLSVAAEPPRLRHQTLEATIAWSHDLLVARRSSSPPTPERVRRLVQPGGGRAGGPGRAQDAAGRP